MSDHALAQQPGSTPLSFYEVYRRLAQARTDIIGPPPQMSRLVWLFALIAGGWITSVASSHWSGSTRNLIAYAGLAFELIGCLLLVIYKRRLVRQGSPKELEWFEEYDQIHTRDTETIDWIASFGTDAIDRRLGTLKERQIGETKFSKMLFGSIGDLGLISVLALAYAQIHVLGEHAMSGGELIAACFFGTAVIFLYANSWPTSMQSVRAERLALIFSLARARSEVLTSRHDIHALVPSVATSHP
jgi:hypothetical protein